ncbi:hypothetical protein K2Z83_02890 [Oscillochloris sp. ZM17-4]|uniref:6-pyruvoyl-tetrahydropterin synthase-related protein n=1 Tax=Oscillochloris sp. ZM17-4 TaxID=2866714 RepID=UPI001C73A9EC|nr:6-pyruvoyl-tetrahydropterin synthase-related protein [Oscillochloris sp. ZM17-4]MBX0326628.1 hypothetical protein [Oscillochloris sp. ZM17-4]
MHSDKQRAPSPKLPTPTPRQWATALGCYILSGLALTWPLATRFATDLPGASHKDGLEDAYQNVWNLWWTVRALFRGMNPLITDRFFFPERPNLFYHTLSPINTLLAAPVTALWGPIAGFNAVAMLSFALGGLGMWALARSRVGHGPALLAGLVYVASPFHMAALLSDGQLQIFAIQWLPWYILFLLRALRGGGRSSALLAGVALTLTAWTDWYYTLFLLIFTAGAVAWEVWYGLAGPKQSAPDGSGARYALVGRIASALLLVGVVSAAGAAPLVAPMLVEATRHTYMTVYPAEDPARLSADLLAFLVPPRAHALWGGVPWAWGISYGVNRRFYLGLVVSALALLALWRRPAARPWGLMALAFGVLALGAELRVNGVGTGLPLPYALLAGLPVVRLTRQPDRFDILVTIALAMLAAHGAAALLGMLGARRRAWAPALLAAMSALVLIDYLPAPITTRAPEVPPFLSRLPHSDDGAILEFPFHDDVPYRDAERMLFQTVHGRPISGGYHSRLYPQPQLGLPALRDLRAGALGSDIAAEPGGWPAALRTVGYRYIIGYKQRPLGPINLQPADEAPFKALVEAGLGVAGPIYEDDWLIAYEVPDVATAPVVQIRDGWGPVERPSDAAPYRWLGESAELGLFAPEAGDYLLSLSAQPAGGPRSLRLELPGGPAEVALPAGWRHYRLLLGLPAGRTIIGLRGLEPPTSGDALEGNGDTRPISVRASMITLGRADR